MISGDPISGAPISGSEWPEVRIAFRSPFADDLGGGGVVSGAGAYELTGLAGSYAYTGGTATLLVNKVLIGQAGSYAYTGNDAIIIKSKVINALSGSYSYNGGQAVLSWSGEVTPSGDNYLIRVRRRGRR